MRTLYAVVTSTLVALATLAPPSQAALRYTLVTDIVREDGDETESERFVDQVLVDGGNARVDSTRFDGDKPGKSEYIVTNDGGKHLAIGIEGKAVCGEWSVDEFGSDMGALLNKGSNFINGEFTELSVEKVEEKPGPSMHGHPTTYLKLDSVFAVVGKILFKKLEYRAEITDDVWMTDAIPVPQHEAAWLRATAATGFEELDTLTRLWDAEVTGTVLKLKNVVRLTNLRSGETTVRTETLEVTELETVDAASLDPASFTMPECKAVGRSELKAAATRYMKKSVK